MADEAEIFTILVEVHPEDGGTVSGGGQGHAGDSVRISFDATSGYIFEMWSSSLGRTAFGATTDIEIIADETWYAVCREDGPEPSPEDPDDPFTKYVIDVVASPEGGGSVSGGGEYTKHSNCRLAAEPNEGYEFVRWSNGSTDAVIEFEVLSSATYTAEFQEGGEITVTLIADGGVFVSGGGTYPKGSNVEISANIYPDGWEWAGWSDGSMDRYRSFTAREDVTLTARCTRTSSTDPALWVMAYAIPSEGGTATPDWSCYRDGETCTLTAIANDGYEFSHWTGPVSSQEKTISFAVTESTAGEYDAVFIKREFVTLKTIVIPMTAIPEGTDEDISSTAQSNDPDLESMNAGLEVMAATKLRKDESFGNGMASADVLNGFEHGLWIAKAVSSDGEIVLHDDPNNADISIDVPPTHDVTWVFYVKKIAGGILCSSSTGDILSDPGDGSVLCARVQN